MTIPEIKDMKLRYIHNFHCRWFSIPVTNSTKDVNDKKSEPKNKIMLNPRYVLTGNVIGCGMKFPATAIVKRMVAVQSVV